MRRATLVVGSTLQNNQDLHQNHHNNSINNVNITPTRRHAQRPLRPSLQQIDNNAMMRVPPKASQSPLSLRSGNSNNMPPHDKLQHGASRPQMPSLSASAKTSNRTPLAPRVAGSAPPTLATPLSRKAARSENNGPAASRDDPSISTPVSSFLSHNVTPRSGSRKSRVDSTNTTPTGTLVGSNTPQSTIESWRATPDPHSPDVSGLGIAGLEKDITKRPTVSFSSSTSDLGRAKNLAPSSGSGDSKFFFASDAKAVQAPRPPIRDSKAPTFFYANGESIPPKSQPQSSSASAGGSTVGEERVQPRFFHANGTPDLNTSPSPHLPPHRPSSTVSTSSRMTSPRLANGSPGTLSPIQRPLSPSKLNQLSQHASLALRSTPSLQSSTLPPRPQATGRGQSANNLPTARRASIEVQRVVSHGRSASLGSPTDSQVSPVRKISGGSSVDLVAPATPSNLMPTLIPISTPEEVTEGTEARIPELVQSPTRAGHSLEHMNELAANARRERKVLDLEITNSSLAAINRTLEREMRKQTAELRRFRRLSRSGRLSIATSASLRTSTGSLSLVDGAGTPLSSMSEEEQESEAEGSDFSEESIDDGSLSPTAMAESDLRHRKRDERRLQLDLSKHQQLLVDSQKMNQSLKRCLGLTEELITEGKKALDYHVRVSDVELGGRVLAPYEEGEEDNEGMSDIGAKLRREARQKAGNVEVLSWGNGVDRQVRDSGIDVDGSQSPLGEIPQIHQFGGPLTLGPQ